MSLIEGNAICGKNSAVAMIFVSKRLRWLRSLDEKSTKLICKVARCETEGCSDHSFLCCLIPSNVRYKIEQKHSLGLYKHCHLSIMYRRHVVNETAP